MPTNTLNYVLYQVGWLSAVLGTMAGHEAIGAAAAGGCLLAHLVLTREPAIEVRLLVAATVVGAAVEVCHRVMGAYEARSTVLPPPLPPLWLLMLWAQFATTFRYCLRDVVTRPVPAALFGAVGGPLAFWAVSRLGAIELYEPRARSLMIIAVTWMLALLVSSATARTLGGDRAGRYRHDRV